MLETVTGPDTLRDVQRCLDDFWSSCGNVPEDIRTQVATAVAEVSANIIEHAARGASVPMRMELQLLPGEVCVGFHDEGIPADVDLATFMGRFMSATGQFLLATYEQFPCPPAGSFRCPLTHDAARGSAAANAMWATCRGPMFEVQRSWIAPM